MKYPQWYGIKNIGYIWCGPYSEPLIIYKDAYFRVSDIEDCMYSWYKEECEENYMEPCYNGFKEYMINNAEDVCELIEESTPLDKSRAEEIITYGAWQDFLFVPRRGV